MFTPSSLYSQLKQAVGDGGAGARERVAEIARDADGLEITFPSYAALACWGKIGLDQVVQIALNGDSVRSKSAALTLLAALSSTGQLPASGLVMIADSFAQEVNRKIDITPMRLAARQALRDLIVSIPADDLLIPVSQSFMHLSLQSPELANELVTALSTRWFRFGPSVLDQYEKMLIHSADDEPAFQAFFCDYPQLLDPMALQVWSQPDFHGALEPDFVIRRADDSYLVVEIETPGKLLMTKIGHLSAVAIRAEREALNYETFLSERVMEARTHFPGFARADCLAVIGMQGGLADGQRQGLRMANGRRQNVRIVGFDWLLERGKAVIANVSEGPIELTRRHRVI